MPDAKCGAPATAEIPIVPAPLMELRLSASELAALRSQGVIVARPRGRNRQAHVLRFRAGGCEQSRYLGVNPASVAAVRAALEQWQRPRHDALELERMHRKAGQLLRSATAALSVTMQDSQFHFHGRTIRQRRASTTI